MDDSRTILLVSDDPGVVGKLEATALLVSSSVRVEPDVLAAMQVLLAQTCHLLVIDITRREGFGLELLRNLRSAPGSVPVIILGTPGRPDAFDYIAEGIFAFLDKGSLEPDGLRAAIRDAWDQGDLASSISSRGFTKTYTLDQQQFMNAIVAAKQEWESAVDFVDQVIMLVDEHRTICRCNSMLCALTGRSYTELLGRSWDEIIRQTGLVPHPGDFHLTSGVELRDPAGGRWLLLEVHPQFEIIRGDEHFSRQVLTLRDITEQKRASGELRRHEAMIRAQNRELHEQQEKLMDAYRELQETQAQFLQQEKMASIGQLAAGVAHEINNPTGFIMSNLSSLQKYVDRLTEFIRLQEQAVGRLSAGLADSLAQQRKALKVDFIVNDIRNLVGESLDGAERIKKIVQDLKDFSRVNETELKMADINEGLESTLNIVWNELKYKADVTKDYASLPRTRCNLGQLNQVFMNILVNAAHAIEKHGEIRIRTWTDEGMINVAISDTGCGMSEAALKRIFEPFFTTKEVGKGTGLGLSIAYDIVTKHNGEILAASEPGKGSTFTVRIPVVEE